MKITKFFIATVMMASIGTMAKAQPKCAHQSKSSLFAATNASVHLRKAKSVDSVVNQSQANGAVR